MLIIVRHGRTDANASGLLLGHLDPSLDDEGRRQALALARAVGPVDRVVSSPLLRAQETAAAFGCAVETDARWIELDYGALDGRPINAVPASLWSQWRSDIHFAPEGGESLAALGARVRDACVDLAEDAAARTVVVVTHVSPVKAAAAWAMGVDDEVTWRMHVSPASITRIGSGMAGAPVLSSFNETQHLSA